MIASLERIQRDLQRLVGPRDPHETAGALHAAGEYLRREFETAGLAVAAQEVPSEGRVFRNIIATSPGTDQADKTVLIVAHYDTKPGTPGADDNASAVAAMLEIARLLAPRRFRRTLEFVGFTLEEYGYQGSRHFVRQVRTERRTIVGVLDLEMVGYTSRKQRIPPGIRARRVGDFIGVVGNRKSAGLVEVFVTAAREAVPALLVESLIVRANGYFLPIVRLSDHAPFWDAGIPAVMITDTAFLRNPHYHRATDTLDTLDLPFLANVATATAATAARLALPEAPGAGSRLSA